MLIQDAYPLANYAGCVEIPCSFFVVQRIFCVLKKWQFQLSGSLEGHRDWGRLYDRVIHGDSW